MRSPIGACVCASGCACRPSSKQTSQVRISSLLDAVKKGDATNVLCQSKMIYVDQPLPETSSGLKGSWVAQTKEMSICESQQRPIPLIQTLSRFTKTPKHFCENPMIIWVASTGESKAGFHPNDPIHQARKKRLLRQTAAIIH